VRRNFFHFCYYYLYCIVQLKFKGPHCSKPQTNKPIRLFWYVYICNPTSTIQRRQPSILWFPFFLFFFFYTVSTIPFSNMTFSNNETYHITQKCFVLHEITKVGYSSWSGCDLHRPITMVRLNRIWEEEVCLTYYICYVVFFGLYYLYVYMCILDLDLSLDQDLIVYIATSYFRSIFEKKNCFDKIEQLWFGWIPDYLD
jgi:hypothetical protein